jgi:hypothetical protein
MAYTYERTFAPSEEVSAFAASKLGISVELAIFAHYLQVTAAPLGPPGNPALVDFSDTGVVGDYIKVLVARHSNIDEKELRADSRVKDKLPVPDISTYGGRYVPPRILSTDASGRAIEDTSRNEYYEIKPNSDDGEHAGLVKLDNIARSYDRYGLAKTYAPGIAYPPHPIDYIPLRWSEAFEYLRLIFMWENNLKQCDLDLQVVRHPTIPGLILYAFRVRLALDAQLAQDKLRALAAGVLFAAALCAAAGILELVAALPGFALTESMLEALKSLAEGTQPMPPPRFRVAPQTPIGPRVEVPPETPTELPEVELEPDLGEALDEEQFPRWKRGIAAAVLGRGYALPGKKMDLFCDEDYFQNVIVDSTQVRRFIAMTRLALPMSMTITTASLYLQIAVPQFILAQRLIEQIDNRLPNQMRLRIRERIPQALQKIAGFSGMSSEVGIVSQVLIQTPAMAAFIDPSLKANTGKRIDRPGGGLGRGKIVLPPSVLAKWNGQDAGAGAPTAAQTIDQLAAALLKGNPDERNRKYVMDALSGTDMLRHALSAGPGFTVGIGVHALYQRPTGPVTQQNRFGELQAVNLSRLFVVNVKEGASVPAKSYEMAKPSAVSDEELKNTESFRYLRRISVRRRGGP